MSEFKYDLSIVSIMKYEESYVAEWVAFHKVCGVQHFYIYDNNPQSTMLEVLKPYIDQNVVTLIPWYGDVKMFAAYNDAIARFKNESKYLAYIDADEFIVPTTDQPIFQIVDNIFETLNESAAKYESRIVGGIGVNWKLYGTSNHETKPQGLVIENYTLRGDTDANRHIKSIVNPRAVARWTNPHFAVYLPDYRSCSQNGLYLSGPFCNIENDSPLRINHYFYKSVEEFKFRINRKKCDIYISNEDLALAINKSLAEAGQHNLIEDRTACRFADQVKAELIQNGYTV